MNIQGNFYVAYSKTRNDGLCVRFDVVPTMKGGNGDHQHDNDQGDSDNQGNQGNNHKQGKRH